MSKYKDIKGEKHGRLIPVEFVGYTEPNKYGKRHAKWLCNCECGRSVIRTSDVILRNKSSCGCIQKEILKKMANRNTTHNMSKSGVYGSYKSMMSRCYRKNDIHYRAYGGRGIGVCDEWKGHPKAFIEWALSHGWEKHLTLERVDVNGNYEPNNCKWIPMSDQYKNKQSNCNKNTMPEPYR